MNRLTHTYIKSVDCRSAIDFQKNLVFILSYSVATVTRCRWTPDFLNRVIAGSQLFIVDGCVSIVLPERHAYVNRHAFATCV